MRQGFESAGFCTDVCERRDIAVVLNNRMSAQNHH
jgi:hypothetical protein